MQRFLTLFYISVLFLVLNAPVSLRSAETETIKIKAVGDLVMGTNYPDNRLPSDPRNTLFPKSCLR